MYVSGQNADLPRAEADVFFASNPQLEDENGRQIRTDAVGRWIPANPRHFSYAKTDLIYVAIIAIAGLFFGIWRKIVISDVALNRIGFEFLAYAFFMLAILEIGLLLVGSWNCVRDGWMKATWFIYILTYLIFYLIFR